MGLVTLFILDRNFRVLPNAIHEFLPMHHAGLVIVDITIARCSSLNPFSSCRLDATKWQRVEKDLYLGKSWTASAYLHVQRKKEEDLTAEDRVVIDASVGRLNPSSIAAEKGGSASAWEPRPAGLWIKRTTKRGDDHRAVTAVDVLFGDDAVEAREGWEMSGSAPLLLDAGAGIPSAHLSVRKGPHKEAHKPQPRFDDNGRFKIMQVADLHLSTGLGECRNPVPEMLDGSKGRCEADPRTLDFVQKMLEQEKPNLIVLSGDQVNGDSAPDAQSVSVTLRTTWLDGC